MARPFDIIAILRMGDANAYHLLKPISMLTDISCIHVIRPLPCKEQHRELVNSKYYEIQGKNILLRFWRIYCLAVDLGKHPDVKAFVSFFAFPYGFLALIAGWRARKPVHIGFVGDDWYRYCQSWYGRLLNFFLRKADFLTVTGEKMKSEMLSRGYSFKKIAHLPHVIDVDKYPDKPSDARKFDCLFVGDLIQRKRVDLIISAVMMASEIVNRAISLCVVGDGPLKPFLKNMVLQKGLEKHIQFVGYQSQPYKFFADAKIIVMASEMEGMPFVLVMGMAAGSVPISTDVGTISDIIKHEETGMLVPPGDLRGLAQCIATLITDKKKYEYLKNNVIFMKEQFRFERVAELWMEWLGIMIKNKTDNGNPPIAC